MLRVLRRLLRARDGNVLILTAMGLPVLVGGAGLAVDTTQWYLWKRELQLAADTGALSGAYALAQDGDYAARARADALANLSAADTGTAPTVTRGDWGRGRDNAVSVSLAMQRALPFSSLFLNDPPTISATATAAILNSGGEHCMISLDRNAPDAIRIGGKALLRLGCGIATNSNDPSAIRIFGSAQVDADPLTAVGGIIVGDDNLIGNTTKRPYSIEQPDPMAGLATPQSGPARSYSKDDAELLPGTYSGMVLKASHRLKGGIYTIDGGSLTINANYSLIGSGVLFVLKNGATIKINGGATIDLTAPTAAEAASYGLPPEFAGVLIFEDKATAKPGRDSQINGNATLRLGGAVYMPTQLVELRGNAEPSTECFLLVARMIDINGNPILREACPPGRESPWDTDVRVVRLVK